MTLEKEHLKEVKRLSSLKSYNILDTENESFYDEITSLCAQICNCKIALVVFIDEKRQWFKSAVGLELKETLKEFSICASVMNQKEDIVVIEDLRKHELFKNNPFVLGDPKVVFYASMKIMSDSNLPLGTLCVMDYEPKKLNENQKNSLRVLGKQVTHFLNLSKKKNNLELEKTQMSLQNEELERFAYATAHDLKSPLNSVNRLTDILVKDYGAKVDQSGKEMFNMIQKSTGNLQKLIEGLLNYSRYKDVQHSEKSKTDISSFLDETCKLLSYGDEIKLIKKIEVSEIVVYEAALEQVLLNLIVNAIKYNDKETVTIEVGVSQNDTHYKFYVHDNGPGILPENREKVFGIFKTIKKEDKFGEKGYGIGLATVKKVVESCGGTIAIDTDVSSGARFNFTFKK